LLEKAEYDKRQADIAVTQALESAELALRNAELNVESANRSLDLARTMRAESRSLVLGESVAQSQLDNSRLIAPADGTVLEIFVAPGEAAVNTPVMQIGDLSRIECVAEVNDRLVRQVKVGQRATIKSSALTRDLSGTVRAIDRVVGTTTLSNPSPLAMVDTKTVDVHIEIDPNDTEDAARFVHLQATVEIDPRSTPADQETSVARLLDAR
jgi:HlyD family secretion protein